jgi:HAD superfamily hydrolase (TIGR01458 family)
MVEGVMLDIDGVLTVSWEPLPHAAETVRWLDGQGIAYRLVTNTSSRPRSHIAGLLAEAGMAVTESSILTAVTAASSYLTDRFPGASCYVLNEGDLSVDLTGVQMVGPTEADVILLGGAGPSTGYVELDAVFKRALEGTPVIALHRNARFQKSDGAALDMGAFITGLEAAADFEVVVVGKPAKAFYEAALSDLGSTPETTMMVGDDIGADVIGAQAVGAMGVLVKTGKFRPSDLEGRARPDQVIDDIGQLPALIERLRTGAPPVGR